MAVSKNKIKFNKALIRPNPKPKFPERCPTHCLVITASPPAFIKKLLKFHPHPDNSNRRPPPPPPCLFRLLLYIRHLRAWNIFHYTWFIFFKLIRFIQHELLTLNISMFILKKRHEVICFQGTFAGFCSSVSCFLLCRTDASY